MEGEDNLLLGHPCSHSFIGDAIFNAVIVNPDLVIVDFERLVTMRKSSRNRSTMNNTPVKRQDLLNVVNTLPENALLELANFLDYLRYKNTTSQQSTQNRSDFLLTTTISGHSISGNAGQLDTEQAEEQPQIQSQIQSQIRRQLQLLSIVQRCLPPSQQERWALLQQKLEQETLTEQEHQEFLTYSDLLEGWNAERVEAVVELAKLRGMEFKTLYQELTPQNSSL